MWICFLVVSVGRTDLLEQVSKVCFCVGKCSVGVSGESRVESLDMRTDTTGCSVRLTKCVSGELDHV